MKKFNAQAETHSNRAGALRGSRPRTEVFEQNYTANQVDRHALHHLLTQKHTARTSELHALHLRSSIFFYLFLDYKHKHTATGQGRHVPHLPPPPTILNRLQAQAHSGPDWLLQGSRA